METIKKVFGKQSKSEPDFGPSLEGYAACLVQAQGPIPANEDAARRELEINIHTIEDEGILRTLDALAVVQDNIKLWNSEAKKWEDHPISYPRPWALALRIACSKVMATRFITKFNATTYKIKLRNEVAKIKLKMNKNDRDLFGDYINELLMYCETAIDDATDGQKMMALKVQHRQLSVGLSKPKT